MSDLLPLVLLFIAGLFLWSAAQQTKTVAYLYIGIALVEIGLATFMIWRDW